METKRQVLLIDLSSLYWSSWHATANSAVSEASSLTATAIRRCIGMSEFEGAGPPLVAICCDEGRSFRKDIAPDTYKAARPEKDKSSLEELRKLKERLVADGYLLWKASGLEADDVIASATRAAVDRGHAVHIASADKDMLVLLSLPGVVAIRTHTWSIARPESVKEKFGVDPGLMTDWLALVGDSSDGIAGCPGIGPKGATDLLTKHGSLDGLYAAIEALGDGIIDGPSAKEVCGLSTLAKLRAYKADVMLAKQLVTLRFDAPIEFDEIFGKREIVTKTKGIEMDGEDKFNDERIGGGPTLDVREASVATEGQAEPPPKDGAAPAVPMPTNGAAVNARPEPVTAMVVTSHLPFELQLEPTGLGQAKKLAEVLFDSRLYQRFGTAEAILAVIIRGREMGIPALTALDCFHVIEGKPSPTAHFITSRAESHPDCEYFLFLGGDETYAEYETKNRKHPKPVKFRYDIQLAVNAGLCNITITPRTAKLGDKDARGQWEKRRSEMLRKQCAIELARIVYPGAAIGLHSVEELGGEA